MTATRKLLALLLSASILTPLPSLAAAPQDFKQEAVANVDSHAKLVAETAAWERRRNAERARINWMFKTEKARSKLSRTYPKIVATSPKELRVKTSVLRY